MLREANQNGPCRIHIKSLICCMTSTPNKTLRYRYANVFSILTRLNKCTTLKFTSTPKSFLRTLPPRPHATDIELSLKCFPSYMRIKYGYLMPDLASYSPVRTNRAQISQQGLRADMPLVGKNSLTMELTSLVFCCLRTVVVRTEAEVRWEAKLVDIHKLCHCGFHPTWCLGPDQDFECL